MKLANTSGTQWGLGAVGTAEWTGVRLATLLERAGVTPAAKHAWFDAADPLPWPLVPGWALVIVDRCEALDEAAQHAAFALFEDAAAHGVQWLAAGRLPPVDLALRDDLRTRLSWGHVFALQPLPDAETRAALRREADRRGIFLSDEVMAFLLSHFERDLGNLMRLLDRLDRYGLAKARRVTVPLVRQMLIEEGAHEMDSA